MIDFLDMNIFQLFNWNIGCHGTTLPKNVVALDIGFLDINGCEKTCYEWLSQNISCFVIKWFAGYTQLPPKVSFFDINSSLEILVATGCCLKY